ncbi:MAG: NUDIX domain-containing protein [Devosiaceae bacterium]|nr:NUDIX domain-containing protein [Devosiaceae bacterium]
MKNVFWAKLLAKVFLFFKGIYEHQTIGARAILIDGNKVLLVRQSLVRGWQFPGGGVDVGESFAKTAKRETFEETGYQIKGDMQLHGVFHNIEATNRDHLAFYISYDFEKLNEFKKSKEIIEIKWFLIDELPDDLAQGAKNRVAEIFNNEPISDKW